MGFLSQNLWLFLAGCGKRLSSEITLFLTNFDWLTGFRLTKRLAVSRWLREVLVLG